jgi:hypothetical protein
MTAGLSICRAGLQPRAAPVFRRPLSVFPTRAVGVVDTNDASLQLLARHTRCNEGAT